VQAKTRTIEILNAKIGRKRQNIQIGEFAFMHSGAPAQAASKVAQGKTVVLAACSITILICFGLSLAGQAQQKQKAPTFRIGVETVFVKMTVTDPFNRYVTGLEQDNFKVYEDNAEQSIIMFSQESAPVSVVLIYDVSSSMVDGRNIKRAENVIVHFLETGHPEDEYCLIVFNEKTSLVRALTPRSANIRNDLAIIKAGGRTAVLDAVYLGLSQVRKAKNDRKALILVTDGEDNSSRYTFPEVRDLATECDAQIYAIGLPGSLGYGRNVIHNIVSLTGGRDIFPGGFADLGEGIDRIHEELRHQYVLGYDPSNKTHDGKWRKITIKLDVPPDLSRLTVHAKGGYFAAK
jgi:Ca-activated chloride channel homolog